jgi:CO/xanthine dehydrogenase FAD-binding subunit
VALPILNMAAWLHKDGKVIKDLSLAIGPAGKLPCRARQVDKVLIGKTLNEDVFQEASQAMLESVYFRTSPYRASSEYRGHLSTWLLRETLENAWDYV